MSSHFLFHSEADEIVPFNAQYGFPSQATRALKSTVKITPREAGPWGPNQIIRIDLPAQGYVNPLNTTLNFGVLAWGTAGNPAISNYSGVRCANNANCFFNRVRILYGSLVIEDIQDYNIIVRMLTNATVADDYYKHAGAVYEGMGSEFQRAKYQGIAIQNGTTSGYNNGDNTKKMYFQINLALGLLTQRKLIPTKWLASQLRIELYTAPAYQCLLFGNPATKVTYGQKSSRDDDTLITTALRDAIYLKTSAAAGDAYYLDKTLQQAITASGDVTAPSTYPKLTYQIGDVNLVTELLEFDENYDAAFAQGMATTGVPIHFMSWRSYPFAIAGTNLNLPVQERAKSIKGAFGCIQNNTLNSDDDLAYLLDSFVMPRYGLYQYQWRVGGKYFPSQPVNTYGNACESFVELQKALNLLGNYEAGCQILPELYGSFNYATIADDTAQTAMAKGSLFTTPSYFFGDNDVQYGRHYPWKELAITADPTNGGCCSQFMIGTSFEATNGMEVSGINGEEQNEILLNLRFNGSGATSGECTFYLFTWFDSLIVVRPNNVLDLIQ